MVFDEAIGTTFSMDLSVLLTVPVHLALLGGNPQSALRDGIAVVEAVRRLSDRVTVYVQRGRLQVPSSAHVLYGLLENMVIEVVAPRRGVFHPKLWLVRFIDPNNPDSVLLRLLVLSRNLTADRSWDVALTLEGTPSGRYRAYNRPIGELIRCLPELSFGSVDQTRKDQAIRLSDELRRTDWELPADFESVHFHVLGLKRGGWRPAWSNRLAVISPFCTDDALQQLANSTSSADALVSRPATFAELAPETRARFGSCLTLDEAAETEDGEDVGATAIRDTYGLHAKVYVFEKGWNTHVVVGSGNATNAALLGASNVEVFTELVGKRSRIGGVDWLLSGDDFGEVLIEFPDPSEQPIKDSLQRDAEAALEAARAAIVNAHLSVRCSKGTQKDAWNLRLNGVLERLDGISHSRAWPITVGSDHATDLDVLVDDSSVDLGTFAAASLTGMIAFELVAASYDKRIRFVLSLPVKDMPEARDAAVLQTVVNNREGFIRYLMLLLGDLGYEPPAENIDGSGTGGSWSRGANAGLPLLEELVRAYAREPNRLQAVGRVVRRLTDGDSDEEIVPREFLDTWRVFQRAMERRHG